MSEKLLLELLFVSQKKRMDMGMEMTERDWKVSQQVVFRLSLEKIKRLELQLPSCLHRQPCRWKSPAQGDGGKRLRGSRSHILMEPSQ